MSDTSYRSIKVALKHGRHLLEERVRRLAVYTAVLSECLVRTMHHIQSSRSSFYFKASKNKLLPCKMQATLYNAENYSINLWFQMLQLRQYL